ncbi:MAG: hypothetical protein ACRD4O_03625 [Bryobacteraceae bacterium]
MTPFEKELKRALARREPAEDFAGRVLARAEERETKQTAARWHWFRWTRMWMAAAVTALLLLPVGAGVVYRRHERMVRGEAAKQELLLALRIASSKLHDARQQVMQVEGMEIEQ